MYSWFIRELLKERSAAAIFAREQLELCCEERQQGCRLGVAGCRFLMVGVEGNYEQVRPSVSIFILTIL